LLPIELGVLLCEIVLDSEFEGVSDFVLLFEIDTDPDEDTLDELNGVTLFDLLSEIVFELLMGGDVAGDMLSETLIEADNVDDPLPGSEREKLTDGVALEEILSEIEPLGVCVPLEEILSEIEPLGVCVVESLSEIEPVSD
jgi:hypothetical protein